jgi:parallel beta-helix repeat protein
MDLPALAEALARDGRPDVLARRDGAWLLSRSLVIRPGASLEVGKATLRLRSEPNRFVGLEARGGRLEITDSTVTSWAPGAARPDDRVDDGRAWVLARDGAVMDVLGSRMEQLGYDQTERSGVAWRTGTTSGTIQRSTFAGNWNGVYLQGSRNLQVEDNVFRHNARHGMVLAVGCSNATVRGNQSYANAGHGMVVVQGSNDVTLAGNEVHDNQQTGIDVNNSLRLRLTGNVVYGNDIGLHVRGRARSVVAEANRLTANRLDGLRVSSGARGTAVMDNSIESNVLDGVHLAGSRVGVVRGNTIRANRKAAFSVAFKGSARPFLTENRVAGNPARERVRVDGHPKPTG